MGRIPDYKCSVYCTSWKPKTSVLYQALDYSLSWTGLKNPPLKCSGSNRSSWLPGSLWHGSVPCHSHHTWVWKHMLTVLVISYSINKDDNLWYKSKYVCSYKVLFEFSIQAVAFGIGRTVFPKTCPRTTDVLWHMLSTCRMMSSDIRFGHIWWFLLFDSSGTHTLGRKIMHSHRTYKDKLEICIRK